MSLPPTSHFDASASAINVNEVVDRRASSAHLIPMAGSKTPTWLAPFFRMAGACYPIAKPLRPVVCGITSLVFPGVLHAIRKNALHIFGRALSESEQRRFARQVISSFYDFVMDIARSGRLSPSELSELVTEVDGLEAYRVVRATKRGAILVTAHLGTFEAGLAALAREERKVRVVFKRDSVPAFDNLRANLHRSLGIIEAPIDDGLETWIGLREALINDEVVVMQGDRAVRGQKSEVVPFLHGHLRLPTGPVRLAQLTGAPIVPVFALSTGKGGYRVLLKPAIEANAGDSDATARNSVPSQLLRQLADSIAEVVAEYPHQWLALETVFQEDCEDAGI